MNISAKYLGPLSSLTFTTGVVNRGDSIELPVDVAAEMVLDAPDSWAVPENVKARADVIKKQREGIRQKLNTPAEPATPTKDKEPAKKAPKSKS